MYTLKEAAEAVGMGKPAILKAIQKGRISAKKDDHGQWWIDPAELHRVYPPSAVSKDMLVERFQAFASEVPVHPVHELVSRQRSLRLDDCPFAMQPARLDRVE